MFFVATLFPAAFFGDFKMKKFRWMVFFVSLCSFGVAHGEVIYENDMETGTLNQIFPEDVNRYAGVTAVLSSDVAHSGTKSVKIGYPGDEAGVELKPSPFPLTTTLFTRKYEYYAPGWEGNWPVGLKTSRYFTTPNYSLSGPLSGGYAYMSEKLIWQTYNDDFEDSDYGLGLNNAIFNLDLQTTYSPTQLFGNGLPYIRTGHWYKYETWMELNSAVDVPDGVLKVWIDDVLVYSDEAVVWKSTSRGVPNGDGWQSMWFGGNYSGAIFGDPSQTLYRYIDDIYLSTSLDLLAPDPNGDFDNDDDVDGADFLRWQRDTSIGSLSDWEANFGATSALEAASAVPEPTTSALAILATISLLAGRHRSRR